MRQRGTLRLDHRTWRLKIRRKDESGATSQTWVRLGSKQELPTRAAARRAADRYLDRLQPRQFYASTVVSWSAYCDRYLDLWVPLLASGTQASQASIIRNHFRNAFTGSVHEIDTAAVQTFIHEQRQAGTAPSTIRTRFNLLRRLLHQAVADGLSASPPNAAQIKFPKDEEMHGAVRHKAFTPVECRRILAAGSQEDRAAFSLALYAGLRTGEVLGLTWDSVNLTTGALTIRQQAIDGNFRPLKEKGSAAVLQAPAVLLEELRLYRQFEMAGHDSQPLFCGADGRPWKAPELRGRLHLILEKLGLRRRGMHAFRHACALAMADAGCSPEVIRRAMRHSSLGVTALYLSAAPEDIAAGLEKASHACRVAA